ncbi:MAG TPA: RNA polymerase sigma factor [Candidatus Saccharimonadales bacterium]|nr:RNA polymerase sigma factor [Candidatus Saccharimonadales bacterium]
MTIASLAVTPDQALISRAQAGDAAALENVYRAFEGPVYSLARRLCRTAEDAEDVLQETFMEVLRSIHRYRGDGPLAAWVKKVAASKALMKLRKHRREQFDQALDDAPGGPVPDECSLGGRPTRSALARLDLESAMSRLSDTSRAVVWLHDVEGYTHEEIASMMDRTVSFSKSQLARAHSRLRGLLGEGGGSAR